MAKEMGVNEAGKGIHTNRAVDSVYNPMGVREKGLPEEKVNSVGSEHEKTSPHGANFEMSPGGHQHDAAEASGNGCKGPNFLA